MSAANSISKTSKSQGAPFWQTSHKVSNSISDNDCLRPQSCFSAASQYLKEGKTKKATFLFKKIQELYPFTTWRQRAAYILGRELIEEEGANAEALLKNAVALSDIADYVLFDLAAFYRNQNRNIDAIATYDRLLRDHPKSLLTKKTYFEKANLLIKMKDYPQAITLLEQCLVNYPYDNLSPHITLNLLRCAASTKNKEKTISYLPILNKYYPLLSPEMQSEAQQIVSSMGIDKQLIQVPNDKEVYMRGQLFFDRGDYLKALEDFQSLSTSDNFEAHLMSAKALFQLKRYTNAESMLRKYVSTEISKKSHEQLSDAYLILAKTARKLNKPSLLVKSQKNLAKMSPRGWKTGKAMLLLGNYYLDSNKVRKALKIYKKISAKIKIDEIQAEALWKTGWIKYRKRDFRGARKSFSLYLDSYPTGIRHDKFLYWKARAEEKMGYRKAAKLDYLELTSNNGKSYYRQIGRDRLARLNRKKGKKYRRPKVKKEEIIPFAPSTELLNDRNYLASVELLLLGMQEEAMEELEILLDRHASDKDSLVNIIGMVYQMGEFYVTYQLIHKHFQQLFEDGRGGTPSVVSKLAFPLKVLNYIKDKRLPGSASPFLIASIMREESGFNPLALSSAGAMGLMQIMPKTGKSLARKAGNKTFKLEQLLDPDVSIRLGGLYLGQLYKRFKGNIVLTIASYNAGPTAVRRWAKKMKMDKDEFVESIPYKETRRYTKRVLRTYTEFLRLTGNTLPKIL